MTRLGKFARRLAARLRDKRPRIRWPKGHEGGAIFCSSCCKPVLLIAKGQAIDTGAQKIAIEAHRCVK